MLSPKTGTLLADDISIPAIPPKNRARLMAHVPQMEAVMFPWSVASMVLLGRYPHSAGLGYERDEDHDAVRLAMQRVAIEHLAQRCVTDLSGGELHRVLIARALAQDTPVLLLDEPNAHLDIHHQVALFDLLASLHEDEGRTVVIITHDLNLASMYCDRIMLLNEGRLSALGTPEDVLREDNIREHFAIDVRVNHDEHNSRPFIRLLRNK
jgi:iron complex transport system ATP-binding protein